MSMPTPWNTARKIIVFCWIILVAIIVFFPPATGRDWRTQRFNAKISDGVMTKANNTAFGIELLAVSGIAALGLVIFSPKEENDASG